MFDLVLQVLAVQLAQKRLKQLWAASEHAMYAAITDTPVSARTPFVSTAAASTAEFQK
jgi:hypothetical protein